MSAIACPYCQNWISGRVPCEIRSSDPDYPVMPGSPEARLLVCPGCLGVLILENGMARRAMQLEAIRTDVLHMIQVLANTFRKIQKDFARHRYN